MSNWTISTSFTVHSLHSAKKSHKKHKDNFNTKTKKKFSPWRRIELKHSSCKAGMLTTRLKINFQIWWWRGLQQHGLSGLPGGLAVAPSCQYMCDQVTAWSQKQQWAVMILLPRPLWTWTPWAAASLQHTATSPQAQYNYLNMKVRQLRPGYYYVGYCGTLLTVCLLKTATFFVELNIKW